MKVAEVIEKVKSKNYWSIYDFEEELTDIEPVERDLHIDRARWFETSSVVYKCEDGFVMVSGVTQTYSEMMDWSDCMCDCTAEECFPVQSIRYFTASEMGKKND